MRASALCLLILGITVTIPAAAQVKVQDIADTFADGRAAHQSRMASNPEKWWNGDIRDTPRSYSRPGDPSRPMTYRHVPANPTTVQPLFDFQEMLNAGQGNATPRAPETTAFAPAARADAAMDPAPAADSAPIDDAALIDAIAPQQSPPAREETTAPADMAIAPENATENATENTAESTAETTPETPAPQNTAAARRPAPDSPLPSPRDPPLYNDIDPPPVADESTAQVVDPNGASGEETLAPANAKPIP